MKFVTVLMPVYNCEAYVTEAVESILNQTYDNYELIIVNDCSKDNTLEIINELAARDERIRVVSNEINSGVAASLNRGLELAKGDYILRMDGDDIAVSNRIELQVAFMEAHPEIALSGGGFRYILDGVLQPEEYYLPENHADLRFGLLFKSQFAHPTVIMRAGLVAEGFRYDEAYRAEDYELWGRIAERHQIANQHEILLHYRLLENSATQKYAEGNQIEKGAIQTANFKRLGIDLKTYNNLLQGAESLEQLQDWEKAINQALTHSEFAGKVSGLMVKGLLSELYNATSNRMRKPINVDTRFNRVFAEAIKANSWPKTHSLKSYLKVFGKYLQYALKK
ncbi:MAG: glycosyltransferase family 2 protein [Pseudobutyrivibrio sp.]|nr:glycosyltransferase family 2 protein [Pseudobutyrivibrio sp.]